MKVRAIITGDDLVEGIRFHGDTYYDDESMERLKQLATVLEDTFYNLKSVERQVNDRHEASAKEIKRQLDVMRKDLLVISFGEEIAENIIKLLEETK